MPGIARTGVAVGALAAATLVADRSLWRAMGASRAVTRRRAEDSPHFRDGQFQNLEPVGARNEDPEGSAWRAMIARVAAGKPKGEVPVAAPLLPVTATDLAATWMGHSSVLVELDEHFILTDPVWGAKVSPSKIFGPRRMHRTPMDIVELPRLSAILISHDHYDHLDWPSIVALSKSSTAPFLTPLGVGAHLEAWGVAPERIIELDLGESTAVGELLFTLTPARHFSGRGVSRNTTLWASWVAEGPQKSVFFAGDTGYGEFFRKLGEDFGPFDLSLIPIGAYSDYWPDIHTTPEEALQIHADLGGTGVVLPIHWGTFNLAMHQYAEPIRRFLADAQARDFAVLNPRPGERIDLQKGSHSKGVLRGEAAAASDWWDGL